MKKTTAERIKEVMKEQHLKQIDILEKSKKYQQQFDIKLTKTDLSQYVSGKVVPGQDKLYILALTLNVSEPWLMGFEVPKERTTPKGGNRKIMTILEKRKDFAALVNLLADNEEQIKPEDVDKTITMIETFFLNNKD